MHYYLKYLMSKLSLTKLNISNEMILRNEICFELKINYA